MDTAKLSVAGKSKSISQFENDVLKTIYTRRAVRKYKPKVVGKQLVDIILDAGRMAPSAMNRQPWKFYVISDRAMIGEFSGKIKKAAGLSILKSGLKNILKTASEALHFPLKLGLIRSDDPIFHGAPLVILITAQEENEWASLDIGMCAQNMMLAAKSLRLDSCPIGFAKFVEGTGIREKLFIPDDEEVLLGIIFGYGDEKPEIHERKSDNAVYFY